MRTKTVIGYQWRFHSAFMCCVWDGRNAPFHLVCNKGALHGATCLIVNWSSQHSCYDQSAWSIEAGCNPTTVRLQQAGLEPPLSATVTCITNDAKFSGQPTITQKSCQDCVRGFSCCSGAFRSTLHLHNIIYTSNVYTVGPGHAWAYPCRWLCIRVKRLELECAVEPSDESNNINNIRY